MTVVQLRDVATIHGGGRLKLSGEDFVPSGVPAYGAGGVNGFVTTPEYRRSGVILSSIGARCGKCFLARGEWTTLANTQVILPDLDRVDARFLWYQLNDEGRWHRSGTGQPFIKPADVKTHSVWLPPLARQLRIAAILDQADALRAERRQSVMLRLQLVESIFMDLFGDPDLRMVRGDTVRFSDVVADLRGGRNLVAEDAGARSPNRVLKISAVTTGVFKPHESKPLPEGYRPPTDHFVKPGDLLMSRANTTDLVGAVALVEQTPSNLVLPDKVWRFVWKFPPEVEPMFAWALFRTPAMRRELSARSSGTGGSMKNISKEKLWTLRLPWAGHSLQREFVRRVTAIPETSASTTALDELVKSLQSRAFSGRL